MTDDKEVQLKYTANSPTNMLYGSKRSSEYNTILNVHPIEMQIQYEAVTTAMRLKAMVEWTERDHKSYHQKIIEVL